MAKLINRKFNALRGDSITILHDEPSIVTIVVENFGEYISIKLTMDDIDVRFTNQDKDLTEFNLLYNCYKKYIVSREKNNTLKLVK